MRLSPDGRLAAFTRWNNDVQDVWIYDLKQAVASRFTFGGGRTPVWSPDGSQVAFVRQDTIYRKPVADGALEVPLWRGNGVIALNDWSGDGRYLLFTRWDTKTDRGLWLLADPMTDGASHEPMLFQSPALHGQFGPPLGTPRWIAYDAEEQGNREVFVRTMPGLTPGLWQISSNGGNGVRWRRDGRELYFVSGGAFVAAQVESERPFRAGAPRVLFSPARSIQVAITQYAPGYDASSDGERFLATSVAPEVAPVPISVVMNWQADLVR